jgi:3-phenylpropionate/trans-cinnamate dioxygenase ferredoxin component
MRDTDEPLRYPAAHSEELPEGGALRVGPSGRPIALFRSQGAVYAVDDACTHGAASLAEGWLEGTEIECPAHQGRFCLKTGAPLCFPVTKPIRTYATLETEGVIYVVI